MKNDLQNQYPEMLDLPVGSPIPASNGAPRREAYERMRAAIAAVPTDSLVPIRVDVDAAVATATRALPQIRAMRDCIARELPSFDLRRFDELADRTLALHHVQNTLHEAEAPTRDLPAMYARAVELRDTLVDALRILARYRVVDASTVASAGKAKGYRAVAGEIEGLVGVMRANEAQIVGKTPVTSAQLDRAEALANEIYAGLDERAQAEKAGASASLERHRAFTLFVQAYDDARRAVRYLREEAGDVDEIAPSLYAGRGGRGNADDEVPAVEAAPETPSADAPTAPTASAPAPEPAKVNSKADSIFVPASAEPFSR